jgi:hypothetical protein
LRKEIGVTTQDALKLARQYVPLSLDYEYVECAGVTAQYDPDTKDHVLVFHAHKTNVVVHQVRFFDLMASTASSALSMQKRADLAEHILFGLDGDSRDRVLKAYSDDDE